MAPKRVFKKKAASAAAAPDLAAAAPFKSDTILMIVESPSKCKKIGEILGDGYRVVASKGHLYEIDGLRAIDKKTFEPKYTILKDKQQTVEELRKYISIAARVLLATDGDREGESIAYHICRIFGLPVETTPRVIFHEITPRAILEAVAAPKLIDMSLVRAQQSRAVLDILVGYKLSPLLWRYIPKIGEEVFSAGRCQTPALRLVYDNYLERQSGAATAAAAAQPTYKVHGYFFAQNFPFCLSTAFDTVESVREFFKESVAFKHTYLGRAATKGGVGATRTESAPLPLNTSAIIQACSNQLHISPKQTMQICQTLYQNGYITYMRTDNRKYSEMFVNQARDYITKKYGAECLGDASEITTGSVSVSAEGAAAVEAHEAIRPTHIETATLPDDFDARQKSVYRFIRNHTLESCMRDAVYDTMTVCISAPPCGGAATKYTFDVVRPRHIGWKIVAEPVERQQMQKAQYQFFAGGGLVAPPKEGAVVEFQRIETVATLKAGGASHYTEASLVSTLERLAIGRPSTYSMLVDVIQQRGYVKKQDVDGTIANYTEFRLERGDKAPMETVAQKEFGKEKNKLVIQPAGIMAIEFLLKYFDEFFSYDYTAKMEERLDTIAHGGEQWNHICRDTNKTLKELITPVTDMSKKQYKLDEHHEVIFSANGPVIKYTPAAGADPSFKPVKKDIVIDVVKLDHGEYTLDDLVELQNDYLGMYEDQPMYLRNGRFGLYVEWGENKESIKNIGIAIDKITLADVDRYLNNPDAALINNKNVLRIVTPELSVRKGKYGPYIFYKTAQMSEPKFVRLTKEFRAGYMTCPAEDLLRAVGVNT